MPANPSLSSALTAWAFEPSVYVGVAIVAWIYVAGLLELARRGRLQRSVAPWQIVSFAVGLLGLFLALVSPIDTFSEQLFTIHMVQHVLLLLIAPPLLLLGKPIPVLLVGAPRSLVRWVARSHARNQWFRNLTRFITAPLVAWTVFIGVMLVWHLPALYDAALQSTSVHLFEHVCYLVTGMLFWWVIIQPFPGPRRLAAGWRIVFVLAAMIPDTALGMLFIVDGSPIYPFYAALPRLWGISVMDDQAIGGNIMMVGGDAILVLALVPLFATMMNRFEQRELARWATSDSAEQ